MELEPRPFTNKLSAVAFGIVFVLSIICAGVLQASTNTYSAPVPNGADCFHFTCSYQRKDCPVGQGKFISRENSDGQGRPCVVPCTKDGYEYLAFQNLCVKTSSFNAEKLAVCSKISDPASTLYYVYSYKIANLLLAGRRLSEDAPSITTQSMLSDTAGYLVLVFLLTFVLTAIWYAFTIDPHYCSIFIFVFRMYLLKTKTIWVLWATIIGTSTALLVSGIIFLIRGIWVGLILVIASAIFVIYMFKQKQSIALSGQLLREACGGIEDYPTVVGMILLF